MPRRKGHCLPNGRRKNYAYSMATFTDSPMANHLMAEERSRKSDQKTPSTAKNAPDWIKFPTDANTTSAATPIETHPDCAPDKEQNARRRT